jgi:hypothetical protein
VEILRDDVRDFDFLDRGVLTVPQQINCEKCRTEMYPEYGKGIHGQEYKRSDVLSS